MIFWFFGGRGVTHRAVVLSEILKAFFSFALWWEYSCGQPDGGRGCSTSSGHRKRTKIRNFCISRVSVKLFDMHAHMHTQPIPFVPLSDQLSAPGRSQLGLHRTRLATSCWVFTFSLLLLLLITSSFLLFFFLSHFCAAKCRGFQRRPLPMLICANKC